MSKFSNSTKINNMIDEIVNNYAIIFKDIVKDSLRNDIQKLVDEVKKEVKDSYQNYVTEVNKGECKMRCPKCGKVLAKTNDGNYICTPDCKYVFN